jgi:hypothetical protein
MPPPHGTLHGSHSSGAYTITCDTVAFGGKLGDGVADMDTVGMAEYETLAVDERDGVNDEEAVTVGDADAVDDVLGVTVEVSVAEAVTVGDAVGVLDAEALVVCVEVCVTVAVAQTEALLVRLPVALGVGDAVAIWASTIELSGEHKVDVKAISERNGIVASSGPM